MGKLSLSIEADTGHELIHHLQQTLSGLTLTSAPIDVNAPIPNIEPKANGKDNVVELKTKAEEAKPKRRGRPPKAAKEPDPEPEPEEEEEEDEEDEEEVEDEDEEGEDEAAQLTLPEVISRLTAHYQSGGKAIKDSIIAFREEQGVKLLRDLKEKQLPAALQFLNELEA